MARRRTTRIARQVGWALVALKMGAWGWQTARSRGCHGIKDIARFCPQIANRRGYLLDGARSPIAFSRQDPGEPPAPSASQSAPEVP